MSEKDPYIYPGAEVLINKEGLKDAERLSAFERDLSSVRSIHIPASFPITPEGYRAIHRHIFQDVYDWAGQYRSVAIAKGDLFALPPYIESEMERRFALIHRERDLKGFSAERFAVRAAEHICEINAIHPFREGNGRTQRLFLKALARQAGHDLRIDRMDKEQWMRASIESFRRQDYASMTACIRSALAGQSRTRTESRSKDTDRSREMG